ncbi:MAG: flagellar FlbD family protein [Chlamydiales bacterium]|nr:flagellar FlbD family protein [Chlamydiales bacterium]
MIELTKLSGKKFLLNSDLITSIEDCGDTLISLSNGENQLVREKPDEVQEKITNYKRNIFSERFAVK